MTWRDDAACLGMDPEIFFGASHVLAKRICADCPVTETCLTDAIRFSWWGDYAGIRGGMGPDERRRLRRRQNERTTVSH